MPDPRPDAASSWRARLPDRHRLMVGALVLACGLATAASLPLAWGAWTGQLPPLFTGPLGARRIVALLVALGALYAVTALYASGRPHLAGWFPLLLAVAVPPIFEPGAFAPNNVPQGLWLPFVLALAVSRWSLVLATLVVTVLVTLLVHPQAFGTPGTVGVGLVLAALLTATRLMREQLTQESASARQLHVDAMRALGDAEATVRALFEGLGDAVVLTDTQRRIRAVNQAFEQLFGYTAAEVLGRSTAFLYAEAEDYERVGRRRHARMLQGLPNLHEVQYRRKDGSTFWAEATGRRILGSDGRAIGTIGVHRDISERRRAEGLARKSRTQMERFVREAPNQIAMFDREMRYMACSQRWLGERGNGHADLVGRSHYELISDLPERWKQVHARALQGHSAQADEDRWDRADGSTLWLRWSVVPWFDGDDEVGGLVLLTEDLTQEVRRREALRDEQARLEGLVARRTADLAAANQALAERAAAIADLYDHAPCGYLSLDAASRVTEVNQTALDMLARPREAVLGRPLGDLMTAQSRQDLASGLAAARDVPTLRELEYSFLRGDGGLLEALVDADLVLDEAGALRSVRATLVDNGERKARERQIEAMQRELARRADEAETANRAKSAFLANMSHEIRTPMNAIIGLTHLMARDSRDTVQRERLAKIDDAARHLLQVINDILDLSKIEAGRLQLEQTEFALDPLLSRAFEMVSARAREKGLELVLETDGLPERLRGDPTRLSQAWINLLSNAVKFTHSGWVRLACELLREERGRLLVRFEVADTGEGIAPERLGALFKAFEQADASTSRRHGGTGLGLALTRHLAQLMGGEVGASSVPGEGSRFWFTAWLERAPEAGDHAAPVPLAGLRVLLVDDLPEARAALAERLQAMGLEVEALASGAEALAAVDRAGASIRPYDLLLVDWRMEPMDGFATLAGLRQRLGEGMPPAILVTAFDEPAMWRQARQARCEAVLVKPVTPSALHDAMVRVVRRRGAPVSAPMVPADGAEVLLRTHHAGQRVLLVEDNPINQEVAVELLRALGLQVETADDGARAVEMVGSRAYDLVLMDVQMPGVDGLEATRRIRRSRGPALPIVAMTANAFAEDRQACLDAGMNDHLTKPVDPARLHAMLLHWLPLRRGHATPPAAPATPTPQAAREAAASSEDQLWRRLAAVPGFDLQAAMVHLGGQFDSLRRVLHSFADTYAEGEPALGEGVDARRVQTTCHSLRGVCAAIGADALQQQAGALERRLADGEPPAALREPLAELDAALRQLAQRLRRALTA